MRFLHYLTPTKSQGELSARLFYSLWFMYNLAPLEYSFRKLLKEASSKVSNLPYLLSCEVNYEIYR